MLGILIYKIDSTYSFFDQLFIDITNKQAMITCLMTPIRRDI